MSSNIKKTVNVSVQLTEKDVEKVEALSVKKGQSFDDTLESTLKNAVKSIPAKLKSKDMPVTDLSIKEAGVSQEGYPYVRLSNGRIFFDHPGNYRSVMLYNLYRDITPKAVGPQSYSVAMSIMKRYHLRAKHLPVNASVAVEVGAYVGYKAIGYCDHMRAGAKVLAIELAPENFRLLCKNIEENGLQKSIIPVNKGVWSERVEIPYSGLSGMKYAVGKMKYRDYKIQGFIQGDTIDNILCEHNLVYADYVNIQVNGTELEALAGLRKYFHKVKVIRVYCSSAIDEITAQKVIYLLRERGCKIWRGKRPGGDAVVAITPEFIGKVSFPPPADEEQYWS